MGKDEGVEEAVETVVEPTEEETAAEAAFDSGFDGTVETPTDTPPAESASASESTEEVTPEAPSPKEEPVKAAQQDAKLSDEQLQEILAKVKTVDQFSAVVEKLRGDTFGKIGGLERSLKQLLEQTPNGQPIEVKAEDLKGIETEFPGLNLAPALAKDLTAVLSKIKTGAPAVGLSKTELDAIRNDVDSVKKALVEDAKARAIERLSDMHEDWQDMVGSDTNETEFRSWLKKEKPDQVKAFLESWDPKFVGKFLTEFKKAKEAREKTPEPPKPKPKPSREQRLAEAIPAKGGGAPMQTSKRSEEEDAFDSGFNGQ